MRFISGADWLPLWVVGFALVTAKAHAQPGSSSQKVAAEALFEEGRSLVAEEKYAAGCQKFADSERLDASAATLLNLANCWEKLGRTATAWATYKEAASVANGAGRKDYVSAAQRHAEALASKLVRITLTVAEPVDRLEIRRDGAVVDPAEWGAAIPIDPGKHALAASAPGRKGWTTAIDVAPGAGPFTVTVPPLEALPTEMRSTTPSEPREAPGGPVARSPAILDARTADGSGHRVQRVAGYAVASAGVVGLAIGIGFVASAKSKYNDSLKHCEAQNPNFCSGTGLAERSDARFAGDAATAALGLGAAAVAGGLLLVLTTPARATSSDGRPQATLTLQPTLGGAIVKGAW